MPRHQPNLQDGPQEFTTETLLDVINDANRIFAARHDWFSPLTSDEERREFISRYCRWWNRAVCPAMERVRALWNEAQHRFELPQRNNPAS